MRWDRTGRDATRRSELRSAGGGRRRGRVSSAGTMRRGLPVGLGWGPRPLRGPSEPPRPPHAGRGLQPPGRLVVLFIHATYLVGEPQRESCRGERGTRAATSMEQPEGSGAGEEETLTRRRIDLTPFFLS